MKGTGGREEQLKKWKGVAWGGGSSGCLAGVVLAPKAPATRMMPKGCRSGRQYFYLLSSVVDHARPS